MTISKKMNRPSALRISAVRDTTRVMAQPLSGLGRVVIRNEVSARRLLKETGAWLLFGGVSLLGWIAAAVAFGFG